MVDSPLRFSVLAITACVMLAIPAPSQDAAGLEAFEKKIRPLLIKRCYGCHSSEAESLKGGLSLDSRSGWARGGDSGPAIVPGEPGVSRLVLAVRYGNPNLQMPPKGKLAAHEIKAIEEWVKAGAPDPRVDVVPAPTRRDIDLEKGREFWSFRSVADIAVPRPVDDAWARGDLDRFLLARMEGAGLAPSGDADRGTLIRRLTFDLVGLPPTPEEVEAFVRDRSEDAYGQLVDRLLASPRFGERWGRHWLDVARFAESSGGGRSLMFPNAWRFRDYVIESFNEDVPFDRFVTEQVAGDLLPHETPEQRNRQFVAAGFLALGPTNYEQQDKELLRMDVIDEQIDTVGRAFTALTIGCARCHDHKFDPIPTTDYYALAGVFGSTDVLTPGNVSGYVEHELVEPATIAWHAHQKARSTLAATLKRAQAALGGKGTSASRPVKRAALKGLVLDDADATLIGEWKLSTFTKSYLEKGYIHDKDVEKGEKSATFAPDIPAAGLYEVRLAYTSGSNRATNVPVVIDGIGGLRTVMVNQRRPPPIDGMFVSLGVARFGKGMGAVITVSNKGTDGHVIVDGLQLLRSKGAAAQRRKPVRSVPEQSKLEQRVARLKNELARLDKKAPPPPAKAMSVRDASKPADGHVHIRGGVRNFGPKVPRGFVTVCSDGPAEIPAGRSGRLELARWLTDPDHPLTSRVYVNRVWQHLFGVGIVRTPDNFGLMGERPSHPLLLDWLARQFIRDGWSTKSLIRMIVSSRAYRARVTQSPESDPGNRLLSHAHRRRLDAESIRDGILAASGQLDLKMGGLTIRKITQYDYGYVFDTRRRSVYVPWLRNAMLGLLEVFDVANPNLVTGRRNVSNTSPQSLYLMNSPWVIDQARHAAIRLLKAGPQGRKERIDRAYLVVLGRPPRAGERELARTYLSGPHASETDAWSGLFQALFGCIDFRYLN
ncbi:MAG: hypothetical protein CMJ90_00575 [Planctomycetes bacterium]|nr:hypothetical protein [Planctomycetota bacterium]